MARLLLLNGPNLNLLGTREPALYGAETLPTIVRELTHAAAEMGHELRVFQSNHEGALIDRVHAARADGTALAIVNPGAYTHTSVALRDAFLGTGLKFIEVHLSNVHAREEFRQKSYFSDIAKGVIAGFGATGYHLALLAAHDMLALAAGPVTPGRAAPVAPAPAPEPPEPAAPLDDEAPTFDTDADDAMDGPATDAD